MAGKKDADQENIHMDQVAKEQQENINEDALGSLAPSLSALSAYQAGGRYQSDSYAAMFNAYLQEQKEKDRQVKMTQQFQHLQLTFGNRNSQHSLPKSPIFARKTTGKEPGKNPNSIKLRHHPYGAKTAKDCGISKLKLQPLAPRSADANNQASRDSGHDSDRQLVMEDSEDNGFGSNSLP